MDIAWIGYDGVHPAHRDFAESIGAEVEVLTLNREPSLWNFFYYIKKGSELQEYDIIICNEGVTLRSVVPKKVLSRLNPFSKTPLVIRFCANENYYFIHEGIGKRPLSNKLLAKFVDGGVANSEFTKEYAAKFLNCPIKVVHPPLTAEKYRELGKISPRLGEANILSTGYDTPDKGIDLLLEAYRNHIRPKNPNISLTLLGSGSEKFNDIEGVRALGYVEDVVPYFREADLYVQPGRGEAFGVAVIEALRAGIPAIITDKTGAKEVVQDIDSNLIREVEVDDWVEGRKNAEDLAKGIEYYLNLNEDQRKEISEKGRKVAENFRPENKKEEFKKAFKELLNEISPSKAQLLPF